jgi:hypothetical protein
LKSYGWTIIGWKLTAKPHAAMNFPAASNWVSKGQHPNDCETLHLPNAFIGSSSGFAWIPAKNMRE